MMMFLAVAMGRARRAGAIGLFLLCMMGCHERLDTCQVDADCTGGRVCNLLSGLCIDPDTDEALSIPLPEMRAQLPPIRQTKI